MKIRFQILRSLLVVRTGPAFVALDSFQPGGSKLISSMIKVPAGWWGADSTHVESKRTFAMRRPKDSGWPAIALRLFSWAIRFELIKKQRHESTPGIRLECSLRKRFLGLEFFL